MSNTYYEGPKLPLSQELDKAKYRQADEDFDAKIRRMAGSMSDNEEHKYELQDIFGHQRFLPAGRVQNAMGSRRVTTAVNCFVSGIIEDSMNSVMHRASQAAETMRRGGGIGFCWSRIRPRGSMIHSLQSSASGPISFMGILDAICQTISSSGHRRGAMMAVLRVDHPDIMEFVKCKRNSDKLTAFNISVGVTDDFINKMLNNEPFDLMFEGQVYKTLSPEEVVDLWDQIMLSTWDYAEPGVLFLDRMNDMNNLQYCEKLEATNPCAEQCLPPFGSCILGSFNLTKYLEETNGTYKFNYKQFKQDIPHVVRAMDNINDRTIFPLKEQQDEAHNKRRIGLGLTGLANAGELLGFPYASEGFLEFTEGVFKLLRNGCYRASMELAKEKGPFPAYRDEWLNSGYAKTLPYKLRKGIKKYGIRNSHLTSIAPTGTISLVADNVSGGIEPVFSHRYTRTIQTFDGPTYEEVEDYASARGVDGVTADKLTVWEHLSVLSLAQHYIDSACSKTINVGDDVTYEEFKQIYLEAWKQGCKGATTFRVSGKRYGIFNATEETKEIAEETPEKEGKEATACFFDPLTGNKECS